MNLKELRYNWEKLARTDPLWAICSDPLKKNKQWDTREFFLLGEIEIATVISYVESLGLNVDFNGSALDFGCGVGRLTQALAKRFNFCYGVDISPEMIKLASRFNSHKEKCIYLENNSCKLDTFADNTFSFIYTSLTLQHMAIRYVKEYLREFVRVLKPGGILLFQMPSRFIRPRRPMFEELRQALRLRTRLKSGLRYLGFLDAEPRIETNYLQEGRINKIINSCNAKVIDIVTTNSTDLDFNGRLLYFKKEPDSGCISKQYCVIK